MKPITGAPKSTTTAAPQPATPQPTKAEPKPKPLPTEGLPPEILAAIGQMQQYDIEAFIIPVPPEATLNNPTVGNITFPPAAIEYGLWINETFLESLVAQQLLGSLFNSPVSVSDKAPPSVDWWRALQNRLYEISTVGGGSPFLYGLDNVHGVNYAFGATLFPQAIGTAATFDRQCAFDLGNVTGRESRYLGIPWSFAPILGIAVQPSWARVYETFGEDPLLSSEMGVHDVLGMQLPPPPEMFPALCKNGSSDCPSVGVAACMKHFIGYSDTKTGRDRTPAWIPDNMLMQYFAPSFKAAAAAGVLTTMENYIQVNGQPVVSSKLYLNFLLRNLVGFEGMLVTDYNEIYALHDFHNATASYKESVEVAINQTTIDMGMFATPLMSSTFAENLAEAWREGQVSDVRLFTSYARIVGLKATLGLANNPVPPEQSVPVDSYKLWNSTPPGDTCFFGCPEHHGKALEATRKSMTLLQNDGILPLSSSKVTRVAVIGKGCNSVPIMAGGWTIHWQGSHNPSDFPYGSTILQELAVHFEMLSYAEGCNITEDSTCDPTALDYALSLAKAADLAIVCVGESQYAEVVGDIKDQTLPGQQIQMVEQIAAVQKNIVTILIEGRPRILKTIPSLSRAVLMAYLPGPFGGQAIVETLMGINNPSGRLPISYPKHISMGPIQYWRAYSANQFDDYSLEWTFGTGLSYTKFKYDDLTIELDEEDADTHVISVNVTNVGTVAGSDVVLLFTTQAPRPMPAEVKRLRNFTRVTLRPGEQQRVSLKVNILALTFFNEVVCEYIALRPTFVTIGAEDPFVVPGLTAQMNLGSTNQMGLVGCPFAPWYAAMEVSSAFKTPPATPAPPEGEEKDYFMSSVVCFVGGVIATCFLVFFVRKRNRYLRSDVQLFEPSGV